jgi:hypothetical protein
MVACAGAGVTPTDSGIEGLVTIGPICPVLREDTPCPDEPFQATIVVEDRDGDEVTRVDSDESGRFRVNLAPGRYNLVPQSPNPVSLPFASEQEVEVRAGHFAQITIAYDSGIR